MSSPKRYLVLRSFLTHQEQLELKDEAIQCHLQSSDSFAATHATASLTLELGVACGASLHSKLPLACQLARRAFLQAHVEFPGEEAALQLLSSSCSYAGLALLYGPDSKMSPHYDSPTQPGQGQEWLAMLTVGKSVDFVCNNDVITLMSGDALVMDSMAVLHGVKGIVQDNNSIELPVKGSRLGVLLWQARSVANVFINGDNDDVDGVNMLFQDDSDDDDDDD